VTAPAKRPLLVLAGGFSRRMGRDKAGLPWDGTPLLLRIIARLGSLGGEVRVAARPGQELPRGVYRRVDDARPGEGPLAGLAAGLLGPGGETGGPRVAVAACDYPYADPAVFDALDAAAPDAPVVLPVLDGRGHPLMALWRADVAGACERALVRGARRIVDVLDEIGAVEVPMADLAGVDPLALLNVNDRETYERLRGQAPGSTTAR
jgi:molybdopterin-guanine dinucleotide biosynthesis protein A